MQERGKWVFLIRDSYHALPLSGTEKGNEPPHSKTSEVGFMFLLDVEMCVVKSTAADFSII